MGKVKSNHIRAQQIIIRKGHPAFSGAKYCTQIVRRIKNATSYLIQHNPSGSDGFMSHSEADKWLKQNNADLYGKLPSAIAQRSTQISGGEWKSFFMALKSFKKAPSKFKARPKKPRYANQATTAYIGRNGFKMDKGVIYFAGNILPPIQTHFGFSQNWNAKVKDTIALEVRIVPKGNCFVIELVYDEAMAAESGSYCLLLDRSRKAGIDLGINNLIAIATDQQARPVLINGKALKSINASYNKRVANLRSRGKYQHIRAVTNKRHRRIKDLLHRSSNAVVNYCIDNNIGTLIIGHNKGWKQDINIGKVNNQKFVNIPHSTLISQIQYKCYRLGINAVIQEESYSSKASALDNDLIPEYGKLPNDVAPLFSGRRTKRGLYKSKSGLLNADINGALNILRKATGEALPLACKGFVSNPIMVDLIKRPAIIRREGIAQQIAA
jgi:IS605 OrfB family transposase